MSSASNLSANEINLNKNPKFILCLGWIIALTWMAVLPHSLFNPVSQKIWRAFSLGHVIGYGVMSFMLCSFLQSYRKIFNLSADCKKLVLTALSITVIWGTFTEILQFASFDRSPHLWDIVLDSFGALLGITAYVVLSRFQMRIEQ